LGLKGLNRNTLKEDFLLVFIFYHGCRVRLFYGLRKILLKSGKKNSAIEKNRLHLKRYPQH